MMTVESAQSIKNKIGEVGGNVGEVKKDVVRDIQGAGQSRGLGNE